MNCPEGSSNGLPLARALAPRPRLLLLDEPFSNLDAALRCHLSFEVRDILKHEGTMALMVTHDQDEAFAMADDLGVMRDGCMIQWGEPRQVYFQPQNEQVAAFVGEVSFLRADVVSSGQLVCALGTIYGHVSSHLKPGDVVSVMLRPTDLKQQDHSGIKLRIEKKYFRGANVQYTLSPPVGHEQISALVPSHYHYDVGDIVDFGWSQTYLTLFHHGHPHRMEIFRHNEP